MRLLTVGALAFALAVPVGGLCARPAHADAFDVSAQAGTDLSLSNYETQFRLRGDATYWMWQNLGFEMVLGTGQLNGDSLFHGGVGGVGHIWLSDNSFALRLGGGVMAFDLSHKENTSAGATHVEGTPLGLYLEAGGDYVLTQSIQLTANVVANYGLLADAQLRHPAFIDFLGGIRLTF
jgi:hypothetical protein